MFDISKLIHAAVDIAEQIHPTTGKGPTGATKLSTAVTLVQTALGIAAAVGIVPPIVATNANSLIDAINSHVAAINTAAKVTKAP